MSEKNNSYTFYKAFKSVIAGFFGVQSDSQRTEDFSHGKPMYFILAGLIGTLLFVVILLIVVKALLNSSPV